MRQFAIHGFNIYENRNGERMRHFPKKSCNKYLTARCRIFDLMRDRKYRGSARNFEIWDGIDAISRISFKENGNVIEKDYMAVAVKGTIEFIERDRDWEIYMKPRRKNQKTGRDASDISKWIGAGHKDRPSNSSDVVNRVSGQETSRNYTRWSGRESVCIG